MAILVTGGTGTVGSAVVRGLVERGEDVRVLVRSEDKARSLPKGATGAIGDLSDRGSLDAAMRGVNSLFLLTPLHQEETRLGIEAVEAASAAGLRHLVFMSIHDVEKCPEAPHFKSKIDIQERIEAGSVPWTLIMPNNFHQNDYWFKQPLLEYGLYPQPFGDVGLSRVDVRDIAEAVVNALTTLAHEGQRYPLVGPDALTATETAAIWAKRLGRDVRYGGNDLDAWAAQAKQGLPEWMVEDFRIMYAFFQHHGLRATPDDLERCRAIVGHEPRSFDAFAAETAQSWKA